MSEEDEIDLIDLFVVLLRYRRLIVISVLCSLLIAAAGYFWYPGYRYNKAIERAKVEAVATVSAGAVTRQFPLGTSLAEVFKQPELLYASLKAAGYESFSYGNEASVSLINETERSRALFHIRRRLLENKGPDGEDLKEESLLYFVEPVDAGDSPDGSRVVRITYYDTDAGRAEDFLYALVRNVEILAAEMLKPYAENAVSAYERLLDISAPTEAVVSAIDQGAERYELALLLISGKASVLSRLGTITVFEPDIDAEAFRGSFKIKALVLVFAVFFLSIFLAFIANAVSQVKKDPESMEKIRDALGKKRS
jgi:hypothetical protein